MGKYKMIKDIIREVMKDGKVHTAEELHKACEKRGVEINRNRAEIYNTVHQLKKKGEIMSDGENGYVLVQQRECEILTAEKSIAAKTGKVSDFGAGNTDFSDFEIVRPAMRREAKQVISVFENGDLALNGTLCKILNTNQVEIRIKKDCSQILLIPEGEVLLEMTKNNRIKNYSICEKLAKKKIKFPVYYVGEWDEENRFWMGELVMTNPNKTSGKLIK